MLKKQLSGYFNFEKRSTTKVCIIILLFFHLSALNAQESKIEIEKRIAKNKFPAKARELSAPIIDQSKKVKYYFEVDGADTSYELKLIYQKKRLSIEYTSEGAFKDIEIQTKLRKLDHETQKNIQQTLTKQFLKYKIIRFQKQLVISKTSNTNPIKAYFEDQTLFDVNYEIEASVKLPEGKKKKKELLLNPEGDILKERNIDEHNDDIILY